jgi:GntR family transcriptional regulator
MDWTVDPASDVPPSRQLVEIVLDAAASGEFEPRSRLPSIRQLAGEAMVNHNTVWRAYQDLERLGVVEGRNGRGVFLTGRAAGIARRRRRKSTLDTFRRSLVEALRAGHDPAELLAIVQEESARGEERRTA